MVGFLLFGLLYSMVGTYLCVNGIKINSKKQKVFKNINM